jgi:hypothetical protein
MANAIDDTREFLINRTVSLDVSKHFNQRSMSNQTMRLHHEMLPFNNRSHPLVLLNFNPETDRTGFRRTLWQRMCNNKSNTWSICFDKPDGVDITSLPAVYHRNRHYPFWLSPRGNGIDCHRTWEALYLDVIPIVWHSTLDSLYVDLPIVIIHDWKELTEEFLRKKLNEIMLKKRDQRAMYNDERLRMDFWRTMILNKSRYSSTEIYRHDNRCWRGRVVANERHQRNHAY